MIFDGMKQESGDSSNNIQAGGNVTIGINYDQARQIAIDVFKSNFYEFSDKARKIAEERAEEITEKFIGRFYQEIPHLIFKLEEPSVQSTMFNAQKEYAKTGDKQLEGRLLDLLIERINSNERSLKQIVLDEAISVIPKLTNDQINILTFIFSVFVLNNSDLVDIPKLIDYVNNRVVKYFPEALPTYSFFSHLEFTGCCTGITEGKAYRPFDDYNREKFKGLFSKGFSLLEFMNEVDNDIQKYSPLLMHCLRNPVVMQFNALDDNVFNQKIATYSADIQVKLKALFERQLMTVYEVRDFFINTNNRMEKIMKDLQESDLKTIKLTSVGTVIALVNYNKNTEGNKVSIEEII